MKNSLLVVVIICIAAKVNAQAPMAANMLKAMDCGTAACMADYGKLIQFTDPDAKTEADGTISYGFVASAKSYGTNNKCAQEDIVLIYVNSSNKVTKLYFSTISESRYDWILGQFKNDQSFIYDHFLGLRADDIACGEYHSTKYPNIKLTTCLRKDASAIIIDGVKCPGFSFRLELR